jgi:predicted metal-dependent hydrolase
VWLQAQEPDKTFLQGLIQVTAAFHHLQRDNPLGTGRLLHAALRRLERYPPGFGGISVTTLCNDIRDRIQALNANERAHKLARARILPAVSIR